MSTYILSLLAASLTAAMVELLSPKGEGGRIASHVRMIAGLFLLAALLPPLREGLRILQDAAEGDLSYRLEHILPADPPEDYESAFGDSLAAIGRAETEAWVAETLKSAFAIPPTACAVEAVCSASGTAIALREVRIGLRGKYVLEDPHPIEAYFEQRLGCPCYVTVIS